MTAELGPILRQLEKSCYEYSLGNQAAAKSTCLKAIGQLNNLLKREAANTYGVEKVKLLSKCSIDLYQRFKNNEKCDIEDKILWFGSNLNGNFTPPVTPILGNICEVEYDKELNDKLKLSPKQQDLLQEWISVEDQDWSFEGLDDLYQDFLQDCSFVVALISLARNNKKLLFDRVTHYSNDAKRFGVRLHFNSCERIIEVGNQLPLLKSKSLFIKSRSNPNLYWPALMEKAYLKVLGNGYDSNGSNASIDTYLISGWVPDFISSAVERPDFITLWEDLYEKFKTNQLVLAIGTGDSSVNGFHPNHDYAIVDLLEDPKSILVKNPWNGEETIIDFHEIFHNFETLYINWNLKDFHHLKKTFIYKALDNKYECYLDLPQFHLKNESTRESEFFVFLEKHLGFETSNINIAIYETNNGEKVFSKVKLLVKTLGNNTGLHLTRFVLKGLSSATIVVFNDAKMSENFTLHAFSKSYDFHLSRSQLEHPHLIEIQDKWDVSSCGGNWSFQSYITNPQYEVIVPNSDKDVLVKFALFTKKSVLVNFQLFWDSEKGKPFDQSKASLINEKYKTGNIVHELKLKSGLKYKLVVSTYDTDVLESFKLLVNSDIEGLSVNRINTRLGLYSKSFKFNWNNKNRFKLRFTVTRQTLLNIHLWSSQTSFSNYRPKIRASLFYENGQPIEINSDFNDNLYGIWLQNLSVNESATIILLAERFETGNDEIFGEIGSDFKIELSQ